MKNKVVNPSNISDMDIMNMKSHSQLITLMQKVGKGKRKLEIKLSRGSQKYLEQLIKEMKKQMIVYEKQLPNLFSFFNYLEKNLYVEKRTRRPKEKTIFLSFEEHDLLIRQMKDVIKGLQLQKKELKWYSFVKKIIYSSMIKETESLLKEIK